MKRKLLLATLVVMAFLVIEQIAGPLQNERHVAHFPHTIDRCREIMASRDLSDDVQRARDYCGQLLRSIEPTHTSLLTPAFPQ